jgi:ubiquinone biosynthesis accessory factor UbiK
MIDPKRLDDLAQKLASSLPSGIRVLKEDLERHLRASLEAAMGRLDLVTREELEVQAGVLARTRQRLQQLEARVTELERQLDLGGSAEG